MPRLADSREAIQNQLREHYGLLPIPGGRPDLSPDSPDFEVLAATFLGLVTDPRTAETSFDLLRQAGLIEPKALAEIDSLELDDLFRQARVRADARSLGPLRKLARWIIDRKLDGEALARLTTETIRDEWRGLNGVGPTTADTPLTPGAPTADLPPGSSDLPNPDPAWLARPIE